MVFSGCCLVCFMDVPKICNSFLPSWPVGGLGCFQFFSHVINNPVINFLVHKSWSVPEIISVRSIPRSRILGSNNTNIHKAPGTFCWGVPRKFVPLLTCVHLLLWVLACNLASKAVILRSDLPWFRRWKCHHARLSFAFPWLLWEADPPFGSPPSCLAGWQLLLHQRTPPSQHDEHVLGFPNSGDCVSFIWP